MTKYYMLRSFDHAGYYETRLILMAVAFAAAFYFLQRRQDARYLVVLISGIFWQAQMEYTLQTMGLRGAGYHFSVFGIAMSGAAANLFQGFAEGGIFSLMAFWFVDLVTGRNDARSRNGYLAVFSLIVGLSCLVGFLAAGRPVTSPRPMFGSTTVIWTAATVVPSVLLAAWRRGLRYLGYFYIGLLIYSVLTFEPLHILGARYIGQRNSSGGLAAAPWLAQVGVMLYSHLVEVAAEKVQYFAVPFALGLIPFHDVSPIRTMTASPLSN